MPFLIKWGLKRVQKKFEREFSQRKFNMEDYFNEYYKQNKQKSSEGEAEIEIIPPQNDPNRPKSKKVVGEYIEFEEIK